MPSQVIDLPIITIASGASTGNAVRHLDDASAITIFTPATLTGTITVLVEPTSTGANFVTLQSGGTDVALPAGKATVLNKVGWRQLSVASNQAEGQTDIFTVTKTIPT